MRITGRTFAVLVPLVLAVVAVPSIAVANVLSDNDFSACTDSQGVLWVGVEPGCEAVEAEYNEGASEAGAPAIELHEVE